MYFFSVNIYISRNLTFWKRKLFKVKSEVCVHFIKSITLIHFYKNICLSSNGVVGSSLNGTKTLSGLIVRGVSLCSLASCLIFSVQSTKSVIPFALFYAGTTMSLFLQT